MCVRVCVCAVCLNDAASCGCCLMQKHVNFLEEIFNKSIVHFDQRLRASMGIINNMRSEWSVGYTNQTVQCQIVLNSYWSYLMICVSLFPGSRIAFSVALNNENTMVKHGSFPYSSVIIYKHVFINMGGSYDSRTGVFTAPRSGVYSITVTLYASVTTGQNVDSCAKLMVNNRVETTLVEQNGQDSEDGTSAVVTLKLQAGDSITVRLLEGCLISDSDKHTNTFTGFLLYPTDGSDKITM